MYATFFNRAWMPSTVFSATRPVRRKLHRGLVSAIAMAGVFAALAPDVARCDWPTIVYYPSQVYYPATSVYYAASPASTYYTPGTTTRWTTSYAPTWSTATPVTRYYASSDLTNYYVPTAVTYSYPYCCVTVAR